jgi:drug/metabolite transporter (DMT)-like permease
MALVLLLYGLFASVFTVGKLGLEVSSPFFLVGSRMGIAGALMLSYLYFFKREQLKLKKEDLLQFFLLGTFNIFLTNVCEFWGLKYLTAAKTCFLYSLSPFVSALLAYLLLNERMTGKKWLGLIVGFLGFIPVLLHQTSQEELTGHFWIFSWAELAVMTAAVSSVYGWIILSKLMRQGYHPLLVNGVSMLIGGSMTLVQSLILEPWNPVPVSNFPIFFMVCIFLMVVSNFICYNLYGFLLKRFSATFISFAGFTTPLITAFLGWIFLGEQVDYSFFLSSGIVFSGLTLFYYEELHSSFKKVDVLQEA